MFLNDEQKNRISDAIRQVEAKTSGEFVAVIAKQSGDYRLFPVFWSALFALALPGVLTMVRPGLAFLTIYELQIISFVACAILFNWQPIKMRLVPSAVITEQGRRLAREQFFVQGLRRTQERTGVLLFVSLAEHYVEIIADQAINDKVSPQLWQDEVGEFIRHVKSGEVAEGYVNAIHRVGLLLQEQFPAPEKNINELPDRLIILS